MTSNDVAISPQIPLRSQKKSILTKEAGELLKEILKKDQYTSDDLRNRCFVVTTGLMEYEAAWELQKKLLESRIRNDIPDVLILTEHPHTITIGKSGSSEHLLASKDELRKKGIDLFEIDRGGDITYHGPGQLVGYPIIDLKNYYLDVHRYLRDLEEVIIRTLADYGVTGKRLDGLTGAWVGNEKIAAMGVKVKKWVTMHGFAFNVNTDLSFFSRIVPCGIAHKGVTSLRGVLSREIDMEEVAERILTNFSHVFKTMLDRTSIEF